MKKILLVGPPNSGKSLLFNHLTGLRHRVANFPGVTVEVSAGKLLDFPEVDLLDFPGIYSLSFVTHDEEVALIQLKKALEDPDTQGLICVVDSTRLSRSLFLTLQLSKLCQKHKKGLLILANMSDELEKNKSPLKHLELQEALGLQLIPTSARSGAGLEELKKILEKLLANPQAFFPKNDFPEDEKELQNLSKKMSDTYGSASEVLLKTQNRIDKIVLSSFWGALIFLFSMLIIFQSIFTWAQPAMNFIDVGISSLGTLVSSHLPPGIFADFVKDAVFGGMGAFLVFIPQIFILTLLIGFLEDTGYLARAAVVCHKPLSYFGLSGKSFVSMLSGFACAIPGIMAARTIESPKRRLLTLMVVPLLTCSARLPVYALLIATLIPAKTFLGGIIGWQGITFFLLYIFGIVTALLVSGFLSKTFMKKTEDAPFILEMPPYRMPNAKPILRNALTRSWMFVSNAGFMIFAVTVTVWILGYFPNGSGHLDTSWLAYLGRAIEPLVHPLGLDWKYGVAILSSFLAREVFVGTLGTLFGIENASDQMDTLGSQLQNSGLTLASGLALLVFYAIALQCFSTLAVIKRETGSWKIPIQIFVAYGLLAYLLAWVTYRISLMF